MCFYASNYLRTPPKKFSVLANFGGFWFVQLEGLFGVNIIFFYVSIFQISIPIKKISFKFKFESIKTMKNTLLNKIWMLHPILCFDGHNDDDLPLTMLEGLGHSGVQRGGGGLDKGWTNFFIYIYFFIVVKLHVFNFSIGWTNIVKECLFILMYISGAYIEQECELFYKTDPFLFMRKIDLYELILNIPPLMHKELRATTKLNVSLFFTEQIFGVILSSGGGGGGYGKKRLSMCAITFRI
ncbi:hypothetical protein ACJX0J_017440 [Zea mays]